MLLHLEYIWIGGNNEIRSKTKIITFKKNPNDLCNPTSFPIWNYDGSSTGQASGSDSEVLLKPVRVYDNPFPIYTKHKDFKMLLILCETLNKNQTPHSTNTRHKAVEVFEKYKETKPWYGIEQEFFMIDLETNLPLGFKKDGITSKQGQYYCGIGAENCFDRQITDEMLEKCLDANLNITGLNFEVAPGQCELQLKDEGIKAADSLIILRYILMRVAEKHNVRIDISAKPVKGDWNGSGCHVNFSTVAMRSNGGYEVILDSMKKLAAKHSEHIKVYGNDNIHRLTGQHETSSISEFSWGVANRGASIRIPNSTKEEGKGYFEDRRPSSSMDPYLVLPKILDTVCS